MRQHRPVRQDGTRWGCRCCFPGLLQGSSAPRARLHPPSIIRVFTSTAALMPTPPQELLRLRLLLTMLQTQAGQRLCTMCSIYSFSGNAGLRTGFGAVMPRPQRLVFDRAADFHQKIEVFHRARAAADARQQGKHLRACAAGMHLPHDSVMQNSTKKRATLTMHEVSSITIIPPELIMDPA